MARTTTVAASDETAVASMSWACGSWMAAWRLTVSEAPCAKPVKSASSAPAHEYCSLGGSTASVTSTASGAPASTPATRGTKTSATEATESESATMERRGSGSCRNSTPSSAAHSGASEMSSSAVAASVSSRQKVKESWYRSWHTAEARKCRGDAKEPPTPRMILSTSMNPMMPMYFATATSGLEAPSERIQRSSMASGETAQTPASAMATP